jgi:hypothetical protein
MTVSSLTQWLQRIALIDKATKCVVTILNSFNKVVKAFASETEFCSFQLTFERCFIIRWDLDRYLSSTEWHAVDISPYYVRPNRAFL